MMEFQGTTPCIMSWVPLEVYSPLAQSISTILIASLVIRLAIKDKRGMPITTRAMNPPIGHLLSTLKKTSTSLGFGNIHGEALKTTWRGWMGQYPQTNYPYVTRWGLPML
jgi:hypothetical protein